MYSIYTPFAKNVLRLFFIESEIIKGAYLGFQRAIFENSKLLAQKANASPKAVSLERGVRGRLARKASGIQLCSTIIFDKDSSSRTTKKIIPPHHFLEHETRVAVDANSTASQKTKNQSNKYMSQGGRRRLRQRRHAESNNERTGSTQLSTSSSCQPRRLFEPLRTLDGPIAS